jgi:hypothetical protein
MLSRGSKQWRWSEDIFEKSGLIFHVVTISEHDGDKESKTLEMKSAFASRSRDTLQYAFCGEELAHTLYVCGDAHPFCQCEHVHRVEPTQGEGLFELGFGLDMLLHRDPYSPSPSWLA